MAYPTIDAPYGLKPVNLTGSQVFAGATRLIKIASGLASNIFTGDVVKLVNDGTVTIDTGTTTATPVGVFVGCTYTSPATNQKLFSQYWPSGTVASDAFAYVVDDPDAVFKIAVVSGTTVIAGVGRTALGSNAALVQNAGSTATGNSKVALLSSSVATTNTLPLRILDVVPETATGADTFVELLVKWNFGMHAYQNATGI